jgi:uncharacterized membrane protein
MDEPPEERETSGGLAPRKIESIEPDGEAVDGQEVGGSSEGDDGGEFIAAVRAYSHEGPLPGYPWFQNVEALAPGSTEKIIDDFTKEREHQREMQKKSVDIDKDGLDAFAKFQMRRIHLAALIAIIFYVGGFILILDDKSTQGLFLLIFWTAVLVLAALYGKWKGGDSSDDAISSAPENSP